MDPSVDNHFSSPMNPSGKAAEKTNFAPHIFLRNGAAGIDFYKAAFGAIELRRWSIQKKI